MLHKVVLSSATSGKEESITINLQKFVSPAATETLVEQAMEIGKEESITTESTPFSETKDSLEEQTRKLFEKIANAKNEIPNEIAPTQEKTEQKVVEEHTAKEEDLEALTKKLFQKIADAAKKPIEQKHKKEPILPNQLQQSIIQLQKTLLAKKSLELMEQNRINKEKSFEEKFANKREKMKNEKKEKSLAKAKKEAKYKARLSRIKKYKSRKAILKKKRLQRQKVKKSKLTKREKAKELGKQHKQYASKDALANALSKHSKQHTSHRQISSSTKQMIGKFYGNEFYGFSGTQKRFIEQNLGNIYVITQRVLSRRGYPDVAIKTRQSGVQLVTFYLHPNGRISGLRLKKRIGYASLDKNTLQVVRIAHTKYPRPKSKTKITFYVEYELD